MSDTDVNCELALKVLTIVSEHDIVAADEAVAALGGGVAVAFVEAAIALNGATQRVIATRVVPVGVTRGLNHVAFPRVPGGQSDLK